MKNIRFLFAAFLMLTSFGIMAQAVIAPDNSSADGSAMLDVQSTTKGFLPPHMTYEQRLAIASPATGLIVWCSDCGTSGELQIYNGTAWLCLTTGAVPGAPTIGTASAGNAQALVPFTAPASNGGLTITSYTATSSPDGFTETLNQAGSGTITVTGLTNGTAYTFTVTATNIVGTGVASAASNSVTPATVPGTPTIGTATAGNAQALVPFTAPASNGGSAITLYTATSNPGNITGTLNQAGSGTITVTGLTNGIAYTFTVKASNAAGTGSASSASNSVTPATVPGAPTIGYAYTNPGEVIVPFTAPASNGGSAITLYTATSSPGGITGTLNQAGSGAITVTGLTNGTAYTFTVTATNAAGTGAASEASNSVTPVNVPGAPTIGTATPGNGKAFVSFTAPASNGGSTITSYTASSGSPYYITGTLNQAGSGTITVTGLTNGQTYSFSVTATNAVGTGVASAVSNSITPGNLPGAPTIGTATAGNAQASVSFTAPASNGGSEITSYTATSNPGNITGTLNQAGSGTITVTGLTNGTAYTFTVTATNAIGTGTPSAASNSVTPAIIIPSVTNPTTGKIWMDRNLGATQAATSSTDAASYGDLYQWGRLTDGHQIRTSGTTTTLSSTDVPGHANFIIVTASPNDWRSPQNANLWQGVNGINNPCPGGYRIPTSAELDAERISWSSQNAAGAFASPLKLPVAGWRQEDTGTLASVGLGGSYWSSNTLNSFGQILAYYISFGDGSVFIYYWGPGGGLSVRCIKN